MSTYGAGTYGGGTYGTPGGVAPAPIPVPPTAINASIDPALQDLVTGSRRFVRDYPMFFEVDLGPLNVSTIRLPHPLVDSTTLQVVAADTSNQMMPVPTTDYQVDERNGLMKFASTSYLNRRIMAAGYHYSWFLDADLAFHTGRVLADVGYGQDFDDLADFQPIEIDTIMMGTVVSALWSLLVELALDIDVSTPEGMYIPARQRYTQVLQLWQSYSGQFNQRMEHLNLGTGRIEVLWLRRVAYLTNRLVPIYREREFDTRTPPRRLYPPIPYGLAATEENERTVTVGEWGRSGQDIGWETLGTQG